VCPEEVVLVEPFEFDGETLVVPHESIVSEVESDVGEDLSELVNVDL